MAEMNTDRIRSLHELREEMMAAVLGEKTAGVDANKPSFNSVDALLRFLTPANRRLLALIRDRKPDCVAALATMTGRAQPNLTRTLAKLERAGFVTMKMVGRRKSPTAAIKKIIVEIDPYSGRDRLTVV